MICPNCGNRSTGTVCTVCGNTATPKKRTGLIVTAILLAVVIAAAVAFFFVLPEQTDITETAKNYVTAAYYTNRVVRQADMYSSYDVYKQDVKTAMDASSAIEGGAFRFLADISLTRTAYAMNSTGKDAADEMIDNMRRDAAIAKEVLTQIDKSFKTGEQIADVLDDAKASLAFADNACVIIGDVKVTFAGVERLGNINLAVIGADILIDGDVLYLGQEGLVLGCAQNMGSEMAAVGGAGGDGVQMDTRNVSQQLANGTQAILALSDAGDEPEVTIYSPQQAAQFLSAVADITGDASAGLQNTSAAQTNASGTAQPAQPDANTGSAAQVDEALIVGTWQLTDAVVNPFITLTEEEITEAEPSVLAQKPPKFTTAYPDNEVHTFWVFREDGTGGQFDIIKDIGRSTTIGFWWDVSPSGEIMIATGRGTDALLSEDELFDWSDDMKSELARFRSGDYSLIHSSALLTIKFDSDRLYYAMGPNYMIDVKSMCFVYDKVSDNTSYLYDTLNTLIGG